MAPVLRAFARLVRARRGEALEALRVQCGCRRRLDRVESVWLGWRCLVDVRARTSELFMSRTAALQRGCKQLVRDNQLAACTH